MGKNPPDEIIENAKFKELKVLIDKRFKTIKMEFDKEWIGNESFTHKLLRKFADKYPQRYESRFSHILPLNSLRFTLEVIK